VKNYVSKQVIEPKLVWEEKIVRALVLRSATAEQFGHKMWGGAESDGSITLLPQATLKQPSDFLIDFHWRQELCTKKTWASGERLMCTNPEAH